MPNSKPFVLPTASGDAMQLLRERISELDGEIANMGRLDDTLQRNSRLFEALLQASQDGIALTTPEATIIRLVKPILGYGRAMVRGASIYDIIHPEDHAVMEDCYTQIMQNRIPQVHLHLRMRKADGATAWVEGTVTDMLDDPDVLAIVHNYRDITWRREAEIVKLEFAAMVQHVPFSIFSKDLSGNIQSWNADAERSFGYTADEAIGQHIWKLVPLELQDEESKLRNAVIQNCTSIGPLSTVRVDKCGAHLPVELTLAPMLKDGLVRGVVHLSRTLSDTR